MTLTFDPASYLKLLANALPKVIATEAEYHHALQQFEPLHFKEELTQEEDALYDLLAVLIEAYEEKTYPMPESPPHRMLQHLMEASATKQSDLVGLIGSSGVVSEVVNGKRAISKAQAKALGEHFRVSPSLFI